MGCGASRPISKKILLVGLDGSGKSTFLCKYYIGEFSSPAPTVEEQVAFDRNGFRLVFTDLGGTERHRSSVWQKNYSRNDAVIYFVDGSDESRINEAKEQLYELFQESDLKGLPFLIYISKSDIDGMNMDEIEYYLELNQVKDIDFTVIPLSSASGKGIKEGMEWISKKWAV